MDQTPGGLLAKRLQEVEDRLAKASGYRLRMVELSGTPLQRLLPNTNPWAGQPCGRTGCYTCGQGEEHIQDCKRRNILYESCCILCNPDGEKKKEKIKEMSRKEGVYVGESARSIFERAREHQADATSRKEDSHILKHWLTSHPEQSNPPDFRIEVVGSFQDALTRQVAEAVRIELRGENVLNSKSEYTRCRIPRLVIDQVEWKKHKQNEKSELERNDEPEEIVTLETGEQVMEVREEERTLGQQEKRNKVQKRKEVEAMEKPANKRRKFDLMTEWGDGDGNLNSETEQCMISAWLRKDDNDRERREGLEDEEKREDEPMSTKKKVKLRQLELNFVKEFTQNWLAPEDDIIPDGRISKPKKNKKIENDRVKPKKNMKITNWLERKVPGSEDDMMEWQDDEERRKLEYEIRKEEKMEATIMIAELINNLVEDIPEEADKIKQERIKFKKERALDRKMIGEMMASLVISIPGQAEVTRIMENVMEDMKTRVDSNVVWSILESRNDIQDWVSTKIRHQRLERDQATRMKAERLNRAKRLQKELSMMEWTETVLDVAEMEWEDMEEHSAIERLMKDLDIDIDDMELGPDVNDGFEDDIEHEFLDKILQELESEEAAWRSDRLLEDTIIDECIKTYSCTGNCTGDCGNKISDVVTPSAVDQGHGKTVKDNIQLSPEVSECIASVHCAGDCTCVQKGTPLSGPGETGYVIDDNEEQLSVNKQSTINSFQIPSFTDWMAQFQCDGADEQLQQDDGHHGGEGRAPGGEVRVGEGGGEGRVGRLVKILENSVTPQNKSRLKTPNRRRGIKRDGLVQTRLASFADLVGGGARKLPGLLSGGGGGKRKLDISTSDSPSKQRRF